MQVPKDEAPAVWGPAGGTWWWISGSAGVPTEAITVPYGGREALALFGHREDAALFLWSLGEGISGTGWRIRESRSGEIASLLIGSRAVAVALDPPPGAASDGTGALVSVGRHEFLSGLRARDGTRRDHR